MQIAPHLSRDQMQDWETYLKWYRENGWEGNDGRLRAWTDLVRKYPDLREQSPPPRSEG